jgi:glycosyltransferase involved in cell wall biosynthesis
MPVQTLGYDNPIPNRLAGGKVGDLVQRALEKELMRVTPDEAPSVLLCQFALPYGPIVRNVARTHQRPYVVVLRGDDVWIWPHDHPDRLAGFISTVRDAALVLGVSGAMLSEARRLSGLPLARAAVLPNGVDLDNFRPASAETRARVRAALGIPASSFVVLCVAAALARKGWGELLDAVGKLKDPRISVLAASAGAGELDLTAEQRRRCPENALILRQNAAAADLAELYAAADLFCLPSYGEGMSNALLEAMAAGLAVITTAVGGHPEVVTDEIEGFFVPPRSVEPLAELLAVCRDDPTRCARMGVAARQRVERVGTPVDNGRRLARLLNGVVDGALSPGLLEGNPYQSPAKAIA